MTTHLDIGYQHPDPNVSAEVVIACGCTDPRDDFTTIAADADCFACLEVQRIRAAANRRDALDLADRTPQATLGAKHDDGKLDYTLIPWEALDEVVRALQHGVEKYGRDNWQHVPDAIQRYEAAAARHWAARQKGEADDPDSGLPHEAHETCCALFLMWLKKRQ